MPGPSTRSENVDESLAVVCSRGAQARQYSRKSRPLLLNGLIRAAVGRYRCGWLNAPESGRNARKLTRIEGIGLGVVVAGEENLPKPVALGVPKIER